MVLRFFFSVSIVVLLVVFNGFAEGIAEGIGSEWVESGTMLRYPSSRYFYGVGRSEKGNEDAKLNAVSAIVSQIELEVKSVQISKEHDILSPELSTQESSYESSVRAKSKGLVNGAEIIATAKEGAIFYAFAAVSKELFAKNIMFDIKEAQTDIETEFGSAQKSFEEGDITSALAHLDNTKLTIKELNSSRNFLRSVQALTEAEALPVSLNIVENLYKQIILSVSCKKISGDKQHIIMGEVPVEPFIVKVAVDGKPASQMAVNLINNSGEVIITEKTDAFGYVTFFLAERAEQSRGVHYYSVVPNLNVSRQYKEVLQDLSQKFKYTVKTAPKSVSIVVDLGNLDDENDRVKRGVTTLLSSYGISDDSCSCQTLTVTVDYEVRESVKGVSSTRTVIRTDVSAVFVLKDSAGVELLSFEKSAKGVGSSSEKSVAKGITLLKIEGSITALKDAIEEKVCKTDDAPRKKSVIVFPFKSGVLTSETERVSRSLTAMLITAVVNSGSYSVVERDQIKILVDEKNFTEDEIDFAKFAKADIAVVGNIAIVGEEIEVDARSVDVESGITLSSYSVSGKTMFELRSVANRLQAKFEKDGLVRDRDNCCR